MEARTRTVAALALLFASLLVLSDVGARSCEEDWPTYRGDNQRTGACGNVSGPGTGEVLWSIRTKGLSMPGSPAVVGDTVYFSADQYVYAVNRYNGSVRWTHETGGGIGSSPAVVNGTLFIGSGDGSVYALNTADGSLEWRYETEMGINSPPSVEAGRVVVGLRSGAVLALDAESGEEVWNTSTDGRITSSPLVLEDRVFVGDPDGMFYALNARNGSLRWTKELEGAIEGSPIHDAGTVFTPSGVGWMHALDLGTGEVAWERDLGFDVLTLNTPAVREDNLVATTTGDHVVSMTPGNGSLRWNQSWGQPFVGNPAVAPHTVYVNSHSGTVRGLNASTGEPIWVTSPTPLSRSSPTLADGVLYVGSDNFGFFAIDAGGGDGIPDGVESTAPGDPNRDPATGSNPAPGMGSGIALALLGLAALLGRREG